MRSFLDKVIQGAMLVDSKYKWKVLLNYIGKHYILNQNNRFILPINLKEALVNHGIPLESLNVNNLIKQGFILRANMTLVDRFKEFLNVKNKKQPRYSNIMYDGTSNTLYNTGYDSDSNDDNRNITIKERISNGPYYINKVLILDSILKLSTLGKLQNQKKYKKRIEKIKTESTYFTYLMNDGIFEKEHFFYFYLNIPKIGLNMAELYTIYKYVKKRGLFWIEDNKEFIWLGKKKSKVPPILKGYGLLKHKIYKIEEFIERNKNELKEIIKDNNKDMKERYKGISGIVHKALIIRNSLYKIIYTIKFSDFATSDVLGKIDNQTEKEIDEIVHGYNVLNK